MNFEEQPLDVAFKQLVPNWGTHYRISEVRDFGDFFFGLTRQEIEALPTGLKIDSVTGPERIVAQRVRGQIRCWLVTHRDPYQNPDGRLFGVTTTHGLVSVCQEFLVEKVPLPRLRTEQGKTF